MPSDHQQLIDTLNTLIETCKDAQNGFQAAAEAVHNPDLKTLFQSYSQQRAHYASELQGEVLRLGGDPESKGTLAGTLHRGWMNIKSVVTRHDENAIVAECQRGEDVTTERYAEALKEAWPPELAAVLQRQQAGIKEAHDRVRALEVATSAKT